MDNQTNFNPLTQEVLLQAIDQKIKEGFTGLQKLLIANKDVLTIDEVSAYTGLSKSYLYKLTSSNRIPFSKPFNKLVYFNRKEIEEWLLQNRVKTNDEIEMETATYLITNS